jgi:hypothetical protein
VAACGLVCMRAGVHCIAGRREMLTFRLLPSCHAHANTPHRVDTVCTSIEHTRRRHPRIIKARTFFYAVSRRDRITQQLLHCLACVLLAVRRHSPCQHCSLARAVQPRLLELRSRLVHAISRSHIEPRAEHTSSTYGQRSAVVVAAAAVVTRRSAGIRCSVNTRLYTAHMSEHA